MARHRHKASALALVAALFLGALPQAAQAQQFLFQFGFGPDSHFRRLPPRVCIMTDSQIRRAVRQRGYHDIYLNVANNNRIQVRATRGDWVYLLRVSTCTGRILDRDRLRPS